MKFSFRIPVLLLVGALTLGACSPSGTHNISQTPQGDVPGASRAPAPVMVAISAQERDVLSCIKDSGQFRGKRIAVGGWVDNTRSTSALGRAHLPGAASSVVAMKALLLAGVTPIDRFNIASDLDLAKLGGTAAAKRINAATMANYPHYNMEGYFMSLDFSGGPDVDLRVAGIGPKHKIRFAILQLAVNMTKPGSGVLVSQADLRRIIGFQETGFTAGRNFDGTLVTGKATVSDQQPLQESSLNRAINGAVSAVLISQMRGSYRTKCETKLNAMLSPAATPSS